MELRRLQRNLKDHNRFVREEAVESLRRINDPQAVEALIQILKDESCDFFARSAAAEALGKIGDPQAVEALILNLKDNRVAAAAEALGKINDPRAIEPLILSLKDINRVVRTTAAEALGKIRVDIGSLEPLIRVLKDESYDDYTQNMVASSIIKLGNQVVEKMIQLLEDDHHNMRSYSAHILGQLGDSRARDPLIKALEDEKLEVRRAAVKALGALGDAKAVEPLIAVLKEEDKYVRRNAAEALGILGDERAIEPLISLFQDKYVSVKYISVKALGNIGNVRTIDPLYELLRREESSDFREFIQKTIKEIKGEILREPELNQLLEILQKDVYNLRNSTLDAVKKFGDTKVVGSLIHILLDEGNNKDVRKLAIEALSYLKDARSIIPLLKVKVWDGWLRGYVTEVLIQMGQSAINPLIHALQDEGYMISQMAAEVLGELGDLKALKPLKQIMGEGGTAASVAVGRLEKGYSKNILRQKLKEYDKEAMKSANKALMQIGEARIVEPLIRVLKTKDELVRNSALKKLEEMDQSVIDLLLQLLKNESWKVRELAIKALGRLGDPKAIVPLLQVLKNIEEEFEVTQSAREAFNTIIHLIDPRSLEPLIYALKDVHTPIRSCVAECLGRLRDSRAVEPLIKALQDESWQVRKSVMSALSGIGDSRAVEPLLQIVKDKNEASEIQDSALSSVYSILRRGNPEAVEPLIKALKDNTLISRTAEEALSSFTDKKAVERLKQAMENETGRIRLLIANALAKLDGGEM